MSWHDEKVIIEVNDENGGHITDVEITKADFVNISLLAEHNKMTVEEQILKLFSESIEKFASKSEEDIENEETPD